MSNPLTAFFVSGIQSQSDRDAQMRARVAQSAIYAQKIVEGVPMRSSVDPVKAEPRISDRPMYGSADANLKHLACGNRGTFQAAEYYVEKSKKRRDELLAKYADE